jgi:hypothetical protein
LYLLGFPIPTLDPESTANDFNQSHRDLRIFFEKIGLRNAIDCGGGGVLCGWAAHAVEQLLVRTRQAALVAGEIVAFDNGTDRLFVTSSGNNA